MSNADINLWSSNLPTRDTRRTAREVSRVQNGGMVRQTNVDTETEVVETKVRNYTDATAVAMGEVARLGQLERALVLNNPELSGRLGYFADGHAIELVGLLSHFGGRLRRM